MGALEQCRKDDHLDLLLEEITREAQRVVATPAHIFLKQLSEATFSNAAVLIARAGNDAIDLRAAYSVKTNPRRELLDLARREGFCAEVISAQELEWAQSRGFEPPTIVYNGPRPLSDPRFRVHVAFADSIEAFEAYAKARMSTVIGVRLRPRGTVSRFGVPEEDFDELVRCAAALPKDLDLGVSFHIRPEDFAGRTWGEIARSVLHSAMMLEQRTGCPIAVLDLGGGWTPDSFHNALAAELPAVLPEIRQALPHVREVLLEPGQALATPCVALFCRVLEIRHLKGGATDAVIDGSIHDAPHIDAYAHRLFARAGGLFQRLGPGKDRLLGCACLEYDILAPKVSLPPMLKVGDLVAIADCGSYDSSMSFVFALGGASKSAYSS
ncbi:MAG: hypothetical protein M3160_02155 [Candidatus Eremiobacteraeota bacterium]|nr:hypothetical protein [Candidatus Eremiobacteraeota bacterium]